MARTRLAAEVIAAVAALFAANASDAAPPPPPPPPPSNVAPAQPPASPPHVAPPTLATAGAKTCTAGDAVKLGPGNGDAMLGFDEHAGLVAWKHGDDKLVVQTIALDGSKHTAASVELAVPATAEPSAIYALGTSYVVLIRDWDWQKTKIAWWGVVVDRDGRAGALVDLGLAGFDVLSARVLDDRHVELTAGASEMTKPSAHARTQLLTLQPDRKLASAATTASAAPAAVAADPDALDIDVVNTAVPPPRGAGGRIYEAAGRPALTRKHRGAAVGADLELEYDGNPISRSMNIDSYIAWSGTRFVYPFWTGDGGPTHDKYIEVLLPIDCHP